MYKRINENEMKNESAVARKIKERVKEGNARSSVTLGSGGTSVPLDTVPRSTEPNRAFFFLFYLELGCIYFSLRAPRCSCIATALHR